MSKNPKFRGQTGTVFLATMVSMFIMLLIGSALYTISDQGNFQVRQLQRSTQAKYLADAGLSNALGSLKNTWASSASFSSTNLGLGAFSASVATSGGRTLVTASGAVQGSSKISTAEVTPPGASALDYVFAAGGD